MPAQTRSATSESLLPSLDYPSQAVRASGAGPDLKLITPTPAPPASEPGGRPATAAGKPPAQPTVAIEAPADDRWLAALRMLTEEEIVALFG
ncbi:MAG TPA: hypothetical protein VNK48_06215 [Xanthobacteraceae bacterium]|nr:hypothetical protein [Xanthobacteraceae bacterium]